MTSHSVRQAKDDIKTSYHPHYILHCNIFRRDVGGGDVKGMIGTVGYVKEMEVWGVKSRGAASPRSRHVKLLADPGDGED